MWSPCLVALVVALPLAAQEPVSFGRDVLPILSDKCFSCHGPDPSTRMANLRLDLREEALKPRKNGPALTPGQPTASLLFTRASASEPKRLMPPAYSHKDPLSPKQVATLERWITQGAPWGRHWSLEKPERAKVPSLASNPIDAFLLSRLAEERLTFSPPASRATLLRRLSFDVTGLPPTPSELDAFLKDTSPNAYAKQVDRLLASPHFGERMAMWWLDAAHYSDTDGFQSDDSRTNWPWRDWVTQAFNRNQPFHQFTLEQFAGDLLPNATPEQKLATSFHRQHMTNGEGGRDPEESRIDYVLDRVNTTGTVWLGMTVGCAQCHTHKFDPISHHDYYSLSAFFNSIDEDGNAGRKAKPYLPYSSPFAARAEAEAQRLVASREPAEKAAKQAAQGPFATWLSTQRQALSKTFRTWSTFRPTKLFTDEGTVLSLEADGQIVASGPNPRQDDYHFSGTVPGRLTGLRLEVFPHASHTNGAYTRGKTGEFLLTDVKLQVRKPGSAQVREVIIAGAIADFSADKKLNDNYGDIKDTLDDDPRNGWTTKGDDPHKPRTAVFRLTEPLELAPGEELLFEMRHRSTIGDANIGRFRLSFTTERGPALESVATSPLEQLSQLDKSAPVPEALRTRLLDQFLAGYDPYLQARAALDRAKRQLADVQASNKAQVMVLAERAEPRPTHVLLRGVWDKKGDVVTPNVPNALFSWPADLPRTRLGLGQWLTHPDNPLTARVIVNHFWQLMFGAGLVRTPEDFGLQGERPTHPELLDWLAVEFRESGWDTKHMLRLMLLSQAYQQSSVVSPELLAKDPSNTLLARGPRYRLPSWMLRDAALQTAGLLNADLGGPPVKPYQPDGVWEELFMGRFHYEPSEGPAQYRRTLYAFWRRTIPPTFLFDNAQRRSCEVRTGRTNTPLQALTLMNDETYREASRVLAEQALAQPANTRNAWLFHRILGRHASPKELAVLDRNYQQALAHYQAQPRDAARFTLVGQQSAQAQAPLAALELLASLIFNLDEAITHE